MENDWKLDRIEIEFKRGYDHNKTVDRYEGKIRFENGEYESFSFKIRPDMANDYIKLISEDIVKAASALGENLAKSLKTIQ